jgi:hypothetical protein
MICFSVPSSFFRLYISSSFIYRTIKTFLSASFTKSPDSPVPEGNTSEMIPDSPPQMKTLVSSFEIVSFSIFGVPFSRVIKNTLVANNKEGRELNNSTNIALFHKWKYKVSFMMHQSIKRFTAYL